MLRVRRTSKAQEDMLDIWNYVALDSIGSADAVIRRIDEVVRLLAAYPHLGAPQDRFRVGLRCMAVGSYLIFYDHTQDELRILRVLHGGRRWQQLVG